MNDAREKVECNSLDLNNNKSLFLIDTTKYEKYTISPYLRSTSWDDIKNRYQSLKFDSEAKELDIPTKTESYIEVNTATFTPSPTLVEDLKENPISKFVVDKNIDVKESILDVIKGNSRNGGNEEFASSVFLKMSEYSSGNSLPPDQVTSKVVSEEKDYIDMERSGILEAETHKQLSGAAPSRKLLLLGERSASEGPSLSSDLSGTSRSSPIKLLAQRNPSVDINDPFWLVRSELITKLRTHPHHSRCYSSLSGTQHKRFLFDLPMLLQGVRRQNLHTTSYTREIEEEFNFIKGKLQIEEQQYVERDNLWVLANQEYYVSVPKVVLRHCQMVIEHKRERIYSYPRFYVRHSTVGLAAPKRDCLHQLECRDNIVYSKGVTLEAKPLEHMYMQLDLNCRQGLGHFSSAEPNRWAKKAVLDLSRDPVCMNLAREHGASFIVCSSVLTCLFDNISPQFSNEFEIPVTVVVEEAAGKRHKIIMLDKPLLQRRYDHREYNNIYMSKAYESLLLDTNAPRFIHLDRTSSSTEQLDALAASSFSQEFFHRNNLIYSLCNFEGIKTLVRCRIHGFLPGTGGSPSGAQYVGIKTKLEYIPTHFTNVGPEVLTMSERSRLCIYSMIRPDHCLLLGRVNMLTCTVRTELIKSTNFLVDKNSIGPLTGRVKQVLDHLFTLEPGSYLLSHECGSATVNVYRSVNGSTEADYDLHETAAARGSYSADATQPSAKYLPPQWPLVNLKPLFMDTKEPPTGAEESKLYQLQQQRLLPYAFPFRLFEIPSFTELRKLSKVYLTDFSFCFKFITRSCPKPGRDLKKPQPGQCAYPHLTVDDVMEIILRRKFLQPRARVKGRRQKKEEKLQKSKGG
ncbi:uncharacterized protein LOC135120538 isoform X1 [Zophobas morio]|uniref:uncharacterized protein LOC135120538 isoform X1 n=1 Tax=Zophobas morio TaxID=2755281 RepID=UPI003082C8B4